MKLLWRTVSWVLLISIVPVAMLVVMGALVLFNVYAFTESSVTAVRIAVGVVPTSPPLRTGTPASPASPTAAGAPSCTH